MTGESNLGPMNGHSVGRILKETVRRAIVTARAERLAFETTAKQGYDGGMDDVFTTADKKAQKVYLRAFEECFPLCGVIGEEEDLRIEPKNGAYFTVDPIDGTKAYIRRQSHGISTMVALVLNGRAIAAYIGDVNTGEIFGYRPGSEKVFRITDLDIFEELPKAKRRHPSETYALLRDPLTKYSEMTRQSVERCKNYEIMGSSIGTWFARLWKGEVQALYLPPGFETPWDSTPVIAITQMLGYKFLKPGALPGRWEAYQPDLPLAPTKREHDILIIHQ